jgi:hypothetical protein
MEMLVFAGMVVPLVRRTPFGCLRATTTHGRSWSLGEA